MRLTPRRLLVLVALTAGLAIMWPSLRAQLRASKGYGDPTLRDYADLARIVIREGLRPVPTRLATALPASGHDH
jgi:hypothetical protein